MIKKLLNYDIKLSGGIMGNFVYLVTYHLQRLMVKRIFLMLLKGQ
ncbi:hypothetical protein BTN50_0109 [Candidatus Enterovibrio altilux]|uniref:Uncharacterized protein n=1 Tax=Candidatus Enterovibrio altilux TaxID=1927128 RepID=A0A291B6N7_9GAMM|nr:hypothetical protein BTN50_0109 [Candidatus Enterovibrio luxaltus]